MKKIFNLILIVGLATWGFADDKTMVTNGKAPKGKMMTLKLEEDLRLGAEDGDAYLFAGMGSRVEVDGRGHIYVIDTVNKRVAHFDAAGKFVGNIGSVGQGPGEYANMGDMQVLGDGRLVLFDNHGQSQHFNYYEADGTFIERKSVTGAGKMLQGIVWAPNGKHMFANYVTPDMAAQKMYTNFGLLDAELKPIGEPICSTAVSFPNMQRFREPAYWTEFLAENISASATGMMGAAAFDEQGNLYEAVMKDYQITKVGADGKTETLSFGRAYDAIPQSEEEIRAAVEPIGDAIRARMPEPLRAIVSQNVVDQAMNKANFPPAKHPINGISVLDDSHVLVLHELSLLKKIASVDIFNSKTGAFVGQYTYPLRGMSSFTNMRFKNGFAYTIETNDDDEPELVRYKVSLVAAK